MMRLKVSVLALLMAVSGYAMFAQAPPQSAPRTKLIVSSRVPSGNTVYAGTWLGVYGTTDGGASWHLYGSGLPIVVVSDLYMPTDGSYLRVSTYGRGVWEIRFWWERESRNRHSNVAKGRLTPALVPQNRHPRHPWHP
jgi:photosystem II stability/assembly factor-like uncharacterized protein